ncbi:hypothetical protein [Nocardia colli]|uniref:hypothetical protein n=1 Tax=Nocardia colli TaxID=2545717 RepID=UPI0035E15A1F
MRIKYIAIAGLFAVTSVAQILGSAAATAGAPANCTSKLVGRGAIAFCTSPNGGSYRATVDCMSFDGTQIIPRTAPNWVRDGQSLVICPEFTIESKAGIQTKDS